MNTNCNYSNRHRRFRFHRLGVLVGLALSLTLPALGGSLRAFIEADDLDFRWEARDRQTVDGIALHTLELTSQVWRGEPWRHQLVIALPSEPIGAETGLLFIAGGSSDADTGEPRWRRIDRREIRWVRRAAETVGVPAAVLFQVPRQPLLGGLHEDAAISRTFQGYLDGAPPESVLLFPMVRSAVRAMDAVQAFLVREGQAPVRDFVLTGLSKRGWTSWLTGAVDDRVAALAPMVIDMLNWEKHLDYHVVSFGEHSPMIRDYTDKGLHTLIETGPGQALIGLVEPYAYRDRFTMPIQILMGANDPYWPVDAVKFYLYDLPSASVLLHYTPNAGHDLGDGEAAAQALLGFLATTVRGDPYPRLRGALEHDGGGARLRLETGPDAGSARIWTAESGTRDFRRSRWESRPLTPGEREAPEGIRIPVPERGYRAFYAEIDFPHPVDDVFPVCTRVFVIGPDGPVD